MESIFIFLHRLIIGRSQNLPDLGSLRWNSEIYVSKVGTYLCPHLILEVSYWSYLNCSHGVVANFFERGSADLSWWPDLTWPWVKKITQCPKWMYMKKSKSCSSSRLASTHEKPEGAFKAPLPARKRVKDNSRCNILLWCGGFTWHIDGIGFKKCLPHGRAWVCVCCVAEGKFWGRFH